MNVENFFAFARERHNIYLRRQQGLPRSAWTTDPIFQKYRFTNVYRELDKTTIWFRTAVRDNLKNNPEVLLATVLFRWFNRIETGRAIFSQSMLNLATKDSGTSWELFYRELIKDHEIEFALDYITRGIQMYCGPGPYVTGSYIIKTPDGFNKTAGVLKCIEWFLSQRFPLLGYDTDYRQAAELCLAQQNGICLRDIWEWLRQYPYMGDFMAYEVVTDLRHTALLDTAPDIMTWANPGPGAMRGLNRLYRRPLNFKQSKDAFILEMQKILEESKQIWDVGPPWEMREVEHTLCEFDKYSRVLNNEGRPRQVFK